MAITLSQGYDPQRPIAPITPANEHPQISPATAEMARAQQEAVRNSPAYASFHAAYTDAQAATSSARLNIQNLLSTTMPAIIRDVGSENYVNCMLVCKTWRNKIIHLTHGVLAFQVKPRPDVAEVFGLRVEGFPIIFTLAEIDMIMSTRIESMIKRRRSLLTTSQQCSQLSRQLDSIVSACNSLRETLPATNRAIIDYQYQPIRECVIA